LRSTFLLTLTIRRRCCRFSPCWRRSAWGIKGSGG
jgi:hypothetical protein